MTKTMKAASLMMVAGMMAVFLGAPLAAADDGGLVALHGRWVTPAEAAAYQEPQQVAGEPQEWGTATITTYAVGACGASSRDATHTYQATNCVRVEPIPAATTSAVGWPIHLPTGALITSVRMHYFDNIAGEPSVGFYQTTETGGLNAVIGLTPGTFAGGNATYTATLATPHQVTNAGTGYQILAVINRTGASTTHGIYGFEIRYRLQVSPAPAVATFPNDVPTNHIFFRYIEALAASGITGGCGAGSYCPDSPVTRGQMAAFLSLALGLHFPN